MKTLASFVLLLLCFFTAYGQKPPSPWSVSGGLGVSSIRDFRLAAPSGRLALARSTYLDRRFSFRPELGISLVGSRRQVRYPSSNPSSYTRTTSILQFLYLDITPAFTVDITPKFSLSFGPYAAYMVTMRSAYKQQTITNDEVAETYADASTGNGFFRSIDMGLRAKAELQVSSRISLFGQFSYGFVNIFPNAKGPFSREDPFLHLITAHLGLKWSLPGRVAKIKDYSKSLPNFQDAIQP